MNRSLSALKSVKALMLFAISLASFLITAWMLRYGVSTVSDSWFYWEGSVNLIEHGTYTTMAGEPIVGFAPLFSIYLALFQAPLSTTGRNLALAMSMISALNA